MDLTWFSVYKEPPKEDLTVSEKFQLVLDVAQKAQVKIRACYLQLSWVMVQFVSYGSMKPPFRASLTLTMCWLTEPFWKDVWRLGED